MTKSRTPTPVYLDPGMHSGLEVKGLNMTENQRPRENGVTPLVITAVHCKFYGNILQCVTDKTAGG